MPRARHGTTLSLCITGVIAEYLAGCAAVGSSVPPGSSGPPPEPPPTPSTVTVTVAPASAAVLLGNSQDFAAAVTNSADTALIWSVNGIAGGNASVGVITPTGTYTAPADLPASAAVRVTAVSRADATKSAHGAVAISSDVQISLPTPNVGVELGATTSFHASITSNGHPDATLTWRVSGSGCPSLCGIVLPNSPTVNLTAQSVADSSKQATTTLTITSNFTLQLSAPTSVPVSGSALITAVLHPVTGSNPSQALTWILSGAGCSGTGCGVLTVLTQASAGSGTTANSATYNAPSSGPNPASVTITATPLADPSKKTQATLTILPDGSVMVQPSTATLAANHRITLSAQVGSTAGGGTTPGVNWGVNGIAGANSTIGRICVVARNPCQPVTNGSAAQVDYVAPGVIPNPNPVSVQATKAADSTKQASAQITVLNHVLVTV
jgi:hypothetical protein